MSVPKFKNYDSVDLQRQGDAFCAALNAMGQDVHRLWATEQWTEYVLDWFACAAPTAFEGRPVTVDARSAKPRRAHRMKSLAQRKTWGEFIVDLAHTTYPGYDDDYWTMKYWERTLDGGPCQVLFALESEWANLNEVTSRVAVLHDAAKVAAVNARAKAVVFASRDGVHDALVNDIQRLRAVTRDVTPWLWIDVPWLVARNEEWAPNFGVLE